MQPLDHLAAREATCVAFDEHQAIHAAYTDLLADDPNQEALKRALFFQWYSMAEPSFSSGIGLLHPEAELRVLARLNELLQTGAADVELIEMLMYYADANWNYGFTLPEFRHLTALQAFIRFHQDDKRHPDSSSLNLHEMKKRGQMGKYWLHVMDA